MNTETRAAIRQEHRIFDHLRRQDHYWFVLQLTMAYAALVILISVSALAMWILYAAQEYPPSVVATAGAALFVQVNGVTLGLWKIVIVSANTKRLQPITPRHNQTSDKSLHTSNPGAK